MAVAGNSNDTTGTSSPVRIVANIFITFIGAGVLGLPYAFKEAGVIEGAVIMTAVGVVSVKAMLLLVDCKYKLIQKDSNKTISTKGSGPSKLIIKEIKGSKDEKKNLMNESNGGPSIQIEEPSKPLANPYENLTYGDVGYYAIGTSGKFVVDICILISQIGFVCAYLIFITENLSDFFSGNPSYWLLLLLPLLYLLTLVRNLSTLALSSLFAQISNLMAFTVVFWFDFEHFSRIEIHPKKISLLGFPFFLAVAIYCYEGAGMVLSLEGSLAKNTRHLFKAYFKWTLLIVTILYISFGICGYMSFGPETNAIITMNLPKGNGVDFAMMVKSCLCLALFFTYPIMLFPVIALLEKKLISRAEEKIWQGNFLRGVVVMLTGLVVMAVPNFANLMALVGATCCTMLAFTLPGLFHMKIFRESLTRAEWVMDVFLIFMGVIGAIVGTLDAVARLKESFTETDDISDIVATTLNTTTKSIQNITHHMMSPTTTTTTTTTSSITSTTSSTTTSILASILNATTTTLLNNRSADLTTSPNIH